MKSKIHILVFAILAALVGGAVVPSLATSLQLLKADDTSKAIRSGEQVSPEIIDDALERHRSVPGWVSTGQQLSDLSLLHLKQAELSGVGTIRGKVYLRRARQDIVNSLSQAPANPYVWLRLAHVDWQISGPSPDVAIAVIQSIRTGTYEFRIRFPRIGMILRTWDEFTPAQRSLARQQIELGASSSMRSLMVEADRVGQTKILERLWRGDLVRMAEFEKQSALIEHEKKRGLR